MKHTHNTPAAAANVLMSMAENLFSAAHALSEATNDTLAAAATNADDLLNSSLDRLASFWGGHRSFAHLFTPAAPATAPVVLSRGIPTPPKADVKPTPAALPVPKAVKAVKPTPAATPPAAQKAAPAPKAVKADPLAAYRAVKAQCKAAGLPTNGSMADLVARLEKHRAAPARKSKHTTALGQMAETIMEAGKTAPASPPPAPVAPPAASAAAPKTPANLRADRLSSKLGVSKGDLLRALEALGLTLADAAR